MNTTTIQNNFLLPLRPNYSVVGLLSIIITFFKSLLHFYIYLMYISCKNNKRLYIVLYSDMGFYIKKAIVARIKGI